MTTVMRSAKRGPGRPPGSSSDATRANILRAARVCFAQKGFGVTTNRDIAEAVGVTPAAIYQYFDSKVALYVTAAREAVAEVAEHMRTRAAGPGGLAAVLSGIVTSLTALHQRDPSLAAFLSAMPSELQRHPEIARELPAGGGELPEIMGRVVEQAVASGEIDAKDAGRIAEMFLACMMGLSQYAALKGRSRAPAAAFAELLEGRLFSRSPARSRARARSAAAPRRATKAEPRRRS